MSGWEQSSTKRKVSCAASQPGGVTPLRVYGIFINCRLLLFRECAMEITLETIAEIMQDCTLCPRQCHARRTEGEKGFCGQGAALTAARAALHYWEEPCLCGDTGSGTVFFSGCSLKCIYCQNRPIALGETGREISLHRLAEIFLELQEKNAANINLVTPGHFLPQIAYSLTLAKKQGLNLPIVYNTGGYEEVSSLKIMDGLVDVYMPDLKYFSSELSAKYSNAPDYFEKASEAIKEMYRQTGAPVFDPATGLMKKGVIVRHMLLPECAGDSKRILRYLYSTYGNDIYVSIMNQYTPLSGADLPPEINRRITSREYEKILSFAERIGIENGYYQEGSTAEESFIPPFDCEGI